MRLRMQAWEEKNNDLFLKPVTKVAYATSQKVIIAAILQDSPTEARLIMHNSDQGPMHYAICNGPADICGKSQNLMQYEIYAL